MECDANVEQPMTVEVECGGGGVADEFQVSNSPKECGCMCCLWWWFLISVVLSLLDVIWGVIAIITKGTLYGLWVGLGNTVFWGALFCIVHFCCWKKQKADLEFEGDVDVEVVVE